MTHEQSIIKLWIPT